MNKLTKIIAVVIDTKKAIFYKEDGTVIDVLQGDPRLRSILENVTPKLSTQGYAFVDFSTENHWKQFEEKTGGAVRFFRIAKDKIKNLFSSNTDPVEPTVLGTLPSIQKMNAAVEEILQHAIPAKSEDFNEDNVAQQRPTAESDGRTPNDRINNGKDGHFDKHPETIVAVTKSGKIIPGVERIKSQFTGAIKNSNTKGIEIFLERISKVYKKRRHTVEDLLRFMERGDLPIADDGTIVIYKKLIRHNDKQYVDGHSRNVIQKVGSFVYMEEALVDPDRRNECSNGLHVARRGYIPTFNGDVIVLAKVRPEDVIAVPDYDANKMRVCGYHIVAELTKAQFQAINTNRPISDAEGGAELLGKVIAGDHIGIIEHVKIAGHNGTNLTITPKKPTKKAQKKKQKAKATKAKPKKVVPVKPLEAVLKASDKPVNVKKVAAKAKNQNVSLNEEEAKPITQADVVKDLWDKALAGDSCKARELLAFKKKARKGWGVWGLPTTAGDTLKALLKD